MVSSIEERGLAKTSSQTRLMKSKALCNLRALEGLEELERLKKAAEALNSL
ncbi:MAG: hypothetical protein H9806_07520 [Candidatus Lactobacillus pullistercoris]|uniref:Uncharacterized protein n=1 Tax=Candidatus Lactobacillus pullistercoris TaxID=2838636 RepID=A0A9E2NUB9_9LACO|nr:hypothetical protein [Candidatus Lactobacillus pullistercoris]